MNLVLPNCETWFKYPQYYHYVRRIANLSKDTPMIVSLASDLGLNCINIYEKIQAIFE